MKRNRKANNAPARHLLPLVVVALIIPVSINFFRHNAYLLGKAGESVAIFSAAVNMPEAGLDLLRERLRGEILEYARQPESEPLPDPQPPAPAGAEAEESAEEGKASEAEQPQAAAPRIPARYAAPLLTENFAGGPGAGLIGAGAAYIKNETDLSAQEIKQLLEAPMQLDLRDTGEPLVLIVHTHATESFERYDADLYDTRNTWRSTDNNSNMVAVGAAMAEALEQNGVAVIHDTTQHDYPSYNGSYERSAQTIRAYLEEYPSIRIVLDLHRDAIERENGTIVKPVSVIDGKKAAQIMIITGCDDGAMGIPEYASNLRFAAAFADRMEQSYRELTRPIYFCYRKYNMDLSPGSLLLEFGSNANTLEESVYSARLAGQVLADLIKERMQ